MSTYADYQTQIAELKKKAEVARREEISETKVKVRQIMDDYA